MSDPAKKDPASGGEEAPPPPPPPPKVLVKEEKPEPTSGDPKPEPKKEETPVIKTEEPKKDDPPVIKTEEPKKEEPKKEEPSAPPPPISGEAKPEEPPITSGEAKPETKKEDPSLFTEEEEDPVVPDVDLNGLSPGDEDIFKADTLNNLFKISDYMTIPSVIKWDITLETPYKKLIERAKNGYIIHGIGEDPFERAMAKINVTPHIVERFDKLLVKLDNIRQNFLADEDVKKIIDSNPEFEKSINILVNSYQGGVNSIWKQWYDDWKNYGKLEFYFPMLNRKLSPSERKKLLDNIHKFFNIMYKQCGGTDKNNPLKYWMKIYVSSRYNEYKEMAAGAHKISYAYNTANVESELASLLMDVEKMTPNSLSEAYRKIEKLMNYLNAFLYIPYEINGFLNTSEKKVVSIHDRFDRMEVKDEYPGVKLEEIRPYIRQIYYQIADKIGKKDDFVDYMKKVNYEYFQYINEPIDCLFEIYVICQDKDNEVNWDIGNIIANYENRIYGVKQLPIENAGGFINRSKAAVSGWFKNWHIRNPFSSSFGGNVDGEKKLKQKLIKKFKDEDAKNEEYWKTPGAKK